LLIAALLAPQARGDSWPAPRTREVFSESREYFVRVLPGESLGDTFGFAGERKGHTPPRSSPRGQDRSYRLVARQVLNPVAPVEILSPTAPSRHRRQPYNAGYGKWCRSDARGKPIRS
jgi:hypothetical protein